MENLALIRNTELAPTAPDDDRGPGRGRQGAQGRQEGQRDPLPARSGQNGDAYHIYPLFTSGGGYLFGTTATGDYDPKDLGVGKPDSIAAFKKIAELGEKGDGALKRSITGENSIATFTGKKCAFLVSGPWADRRRQEGRHRRTTSPRSPASPAASRRTPFVGVQAFYVAAKGKNKALAQEFVANYVTNPDVAVALYQADPRPPALTAALDQVKGTDPDLAKFLDAGKNGLVLPAIPAMAAIWDPFGKAEAADHRRRRPGRGHRSPPPARPSPARSSN